MSIDLGEIHRIPGIGALAMEKKELIGKCREESCRIAEVKTEDELIDYVKDMAESFLMMYACRVRSVMETEGNDAIPTWEAFFEDEINNGEGEMSPRMRTEQRRYVTDLFDRLMGELIHESLKNVVRRELEDKDEEGDDDA